MREIVIKKAKLHEPQLRDDLQDKSPDELIGMMWQLALNAWSFKETVDVEPRLRDMLLCLNEAGVDFMIVALMPLLLMASLAPLATLTSG